uniref:Nucleophosmin/nucleoplasmin 3 n=1 Tax=Crocodylus porosus TaxID=8502 RepID=A0A7M4F5D4_CROPO
MAAFLELQSREWRPPGLRDPEGGLFGCALTSSAPAFTFVADEEDEDCEHLLTLSTVSLGAGAVDECNVVEVVGRDCDDQEIAVPVANLKLSCQPSLSLDGFTLQPPITFRLAAGSGPVHLAGQHRVGKDWGAGARELPARRGGCRLQEGWGWLVWLFLPAPAAGADGLSVHRSAQHRAVR